MRNRYLEKFNNNVKIKITGKNPQNYLKRITKLKINIISISQISEHEINIIINYNDYQLLKKQRTTYQISILSYLGKKKIKKNFFKNKFILLFLVLGLTIIIFLSNIIFKVEVIHSDKKIRDYLLKELQKYDIKKFAIKKKISSLRTN